MTSPFSIGFSTMWAARSPYSSGRPRRCGCGTCSPSAARASSGRPASSGVSNRPGAMVTTRMPDCARSRAAGQRHADDAALGGRVGELADLPVVGGDRGGVDAHPALALVVGLVGQHRRGGQAEHVEGADQVHADDGLERVERVRPAPAGRLLGPADARAADRDPQRPGGFDGGATCSASVTSHSTKRAPSSSASAAPLSAFRSAIVTSAPPARRRRAVAAPSPDAPPATSALVPSILMTRDRSGERARSRRARPRRARARHPRAAGRPRRCSARRRRR